MSISQEHINATVKIELARALEITPAHEWTHQFAGLKMTNAKGKFGMASSRGYIWISSVFIYTDEYTHLINTIRHELAHLIAGLRHHHDQHWYNAARKIGCTATRTSRASNKLATNMKRKWLLVGTLMCGEDVPFQASHTKQSKWLAYTASESTPKDECYTFEGKKIAKFKYIRNV